MWTAACPAVEITHLGVKSGAPATADGPSGATAGAGGAARGGSAACLKAAVTATERAWSKARWARPQRFLVRCISRMVKAAITESTTVHAWPLNTACRAHRPKPDTCVTAATDSALKPAVLRRAHRSTNPPWARARARVLSPSFSRLVAELTPRSRAQVSRLCGGGAIATEVSATRIAPRSLPPSPQKRTEALVPPLRPSPRAFRPRA
mmetsp:Transcript_65317/g.147353  ORF Transcript_65317/g.147353 Transcript_65317/m.147353 type:complete len:208 (-) Transcript_65317:1227-1850(-)